MVEIFPVAGSARRGARNPLSGQRLKRQALDGRADAPTIAPFGLIKSAV
jgi:hypothetical protein